VTVTGWTEADAECYQR